MCNFSPPISVHNPSLSIPGLRLLDDVLDELNCEILFGCGGNEIIRMKQLPISTAQEHQLRCTLLEQTWINQTLLDIYQTSRSTIFFEERMHFRVTVTPTLCTASHGTASDSE